GWLASHELDELHSDDARLSRKLCAALFESVLKTKPPAGVRCPGSASTSTPASPLRCCMMPPDPVTPSRRRVASTFGLSADPKASSMPRNVCCNPVNANRPYAFRGTYATAPLTCGEMFSSVRMSDVNLDGSKSSVPSSAI